MRVIHTSDWHLGVSTGPVSRLPDHALFLDWLLGRITEEEADALVIAGDVFDTMQPSGEALELYYGFLARASAQGVRSIVVVGGNHDNARKLHAPREVLSAIRVHVVGGIRAAEESWESCLVPLLDREGEVGAVVLAVPYVHEFRLGIRTTAFERGEVQRRFEERFTHLYRTLTDLAEERWPGVPLMATGHLTIGAASPDDYPQEIHQVGLIDGLSASIFDSRLQYVALGHLHRCFPVTDRIWYSGSPIPMSLPEARSDRRVLSVALSPELGGLPSVREHVVPPARDLVVLEGPPQDVLTSLRTLTSDKPLAPLVYARVRLTAPEIGLNQRLHEAAAAHPAGGPALVEVREVRAGLSPVEAEPSPSLEGLSPAQVFARLCAAKGIEDAAPLARAFHTLVGVGGAELDQLVRAVGGEA